MQDVFQMAGQYHFEAFKRTARSFCRRNWDQLFDEFKAGKYPLAGENRFRTQCFKSAWMAAMLHTGHHFSTGQKLTSVKMINGVEVGWTLGAVLFLVRNETGNTHQSCPGENDKDHDLWSWTPLWSNKDISENLVMFLAMAVLGLTMVLLSLCIRRHRMSLTRPLDFVGAV
eukprot:m.239027 g.239027  ORF g.239027 m.239027 type:complete len:171 (-) comp18975_c0_seq3:65-577(-)